MDQPTIVSRTSAASRPFAPEATLWHYAALLGAGVVLAGIHEGWNLRLGLPGHFGLIWMTGLVCARHSSGVRHAALLTALGYAAGTAGFTNFSPHELAHAPGYAVCAWALDFAWRRWPSRLQRVAWAGLAGGLAFVLKPLVMLALAHGASLPMGALRFGALFPLLTHFSFGAVGAIIGTLAWRAAHPTPARTTRCD
jgi:hypothetical protein